MGNNKYFYLKLKIYNSIEQDSHSQSSVTSVPIHAYCIVYIQHLTTIDLEELQFKNNLY